MYSHDVEYAGSVSGWTGPVRQRPTGTLAGIVSCHEEQAAREIAAVIEYRPSCWEELTGRLESIWAKEPGQHDAQDRVWLAALALLPADVSRRLSWDACERGRYAAARCIVHHRH